MAKATRLTIEQALQQGVVAHKEGKLKDAERFYRAILQSQPAHPDANHNLAIVLLGTGRTEESLQHFKKAIEVREGPTRVTTTSEALH